MRIGRLEKIMIFIALLGIGMVLILIALFANYQPDYSCTETFHQLLINQNLFPDGWQMGEPRKDEMQGVGLVDYCGVEYLVTNGVAYSDYFEYKASDFASEGFITKRQIEFVSRDEIDSPWRELEMSFDNQLLAEEKYLACADVGGIPMCRFLARYGNYIVLFNTHMSPKFMTTESLSNILLAIDEIMAMAVLGDN